MPVNTIDRINNLLTKQLESLGEALLDFGAIDDLTKLVGDSEMKMIKGIDQAIGLTIENLAKSVRKQYPIFSRLHSTRDFSSQNDC